jgi:putative NADPH-quinone reductase
MARRIAIVLGHPDPSPQTFCHALAEAYRAGAGEVGHETRLIEVAKLPFDFLRSAGDFRDGDVPAGLIDAQDAIGWCDHLVVIYPLWLGTMPALLKGFFEQCLRPGFAFEESGKGFPKGKLRCSARVVVTMGMPVLAYRWFYGAHSLRSLERNILRLCGMRPVRDTLFGMVEMRSAGTRKRWLEKVTALGRRGQ